MHGKNPALRSLFWVRSPPGRPWPRVQVFMSRSFIIHFYFYSPPALIYTTSHHWALSLRVRVGAQRVASLMQKTRYDSLELKSKCSNIKLPKPSCLKL